MVTMTMDPGCCVEYGLYKQKPFTFYFIVCHCKVQIKVVHEPYLRLSFGVLENMGKQST